MVYQAANDNFKAQAKPKKPASGKKRTKASKKHTSANKETVK